MIYKDLGGTGIMIPAIGLGTWQIGGREDPDYSNDNEAINTLETAIEMGYTHIDTAEHYGGGHCEELIGTAIRNFSREKFFIVSKAWPNHLSNIDLPKSVEKSMERLGVDYIDLYLIHWPNPEIPLRETLKTLSDLKKLGIIKNIGVSNFEYPLLKEAVEISSEPIVCDQVLYNIEDREPEPYLLPYCQKNKITLTAYTPLRRLTLTESIRLNLEKIAIRHDVSISQVMLAWLINKENVVAIPKASKFQHMKDNFEAADLILSQEEVQLLDSI